MKDCWNRQPKPKEVIRPRPENVSSKPPLERPKKSKKVNFVPELVEDPPEIQHSAYVKREESSTEGPSLISGGLWTDDDILLLVKLVNKHPAGEPERWIKIAEAMNRSVPEVTHMANKIKDNDFRIPAESEVPQIEEEYRKVKTKGGKLGVKITDAEAESKKSTPWTQTQQKAFEMALMKYSKKSAVDRWEKIASCVPGKTKEDCILRYKKLAAVVRQRQSGENSASESDLKKEESEENSQPNADVTQTDEAEIPGTDDARSIDE